MVGLDPRAWTVPMQRALACVLFGAACFAAGRWTAPSPTVHPSAAPLDVNQVTSAELQLLPGISASVAQQIVEHREHHGPIARIEDLRQVRGIGPQTFDQLRAHLYVRAALEPPSKPRSTPWQKPQPTALPGSAAPELIDVNVSDARELQKLPGIGPKMAQRILDERALRGPFRTPEDLRRVAGIGPKTLEKLRPLVTTSQPALVAVQHTSQ